MYRTAKSTIYFCNFLFLQFPIFVLFISYLPDIKRMNMKRLVFFLCVFCSLYLQAQTDTVSYKKNIELPEVVITGTGTAHYIKNAPVQTEVISGKALRNYAGRSMEDILGLLSASFNFSSNDMGSGMQLNGLGNGYILILLDGKKINGDLGGQNDLNTIDITNIERIEIVKGAASALYGSDAIAGVVNFITRKSNDRLSFSNTSRIGCYADILQSNTLNFNTKKINATTSFHFKNTDGWQNTTQEWYRHKLYENSVTRTVNPSHNYKISQTLTFQPFEKLSVKADASYYERWTDRPTGFPQWQLKNFYYNDKNYSFETTYRLTKKNTLSADVSYGNYNYYYDYTQREYTDFFDNNNNRIVFYPGDRVMQSSQRRLLSRAKAIFYLGEKQIWSTGIEHNAEMLVSPLRLAGGERASVYTLSAYVQNEINLIENLNITPGIRVVHHKAFGQIATPKISAMYKLGDFSLRATYSNGFKAPTVKELYYSYIATIMTNMKAYYGNENLRPQRSNYFALGGQYHGTNLRTNLTVYYNGVRDMIALQPVPTSPQDKLLEVEETMRYENLAKARNFGADFTFDLTLNGGFTLGGGYSYVNAKAQDPEQTNFLEYRPINGTSLHNATLRAAWEHTWRSYRFGVNLFGRYQSKRFYVTDGDADDHQIWRLNTSHSLLQLKKWTLDVNAGVDNIFNYVDRTPFGHNRATSTPGRTVYVSLSVMFQNKQSGKKQRIRKSYEPAPNESSEEENGN